MSPTDTSGTIVQEVSIRGTAERIFDALTNPNQLPLWWHAEGKFRFTDVEADLRPGGKFSMRGSGYGGKTVHVHGTYRIVERPHVLEMTWNPDWQGDATESVVRYELNEQDGVTSVRLTHSGLTTDASRNSHQGWPWILTLLQGWVEKASH